MAKKLSYTPIDLGDTKDLSEEEWLKWRQHGPKYNDPSSPEFIPVAIGGSDAAVIHGDSDFKSKLELFHEKSGIKEAKYKKPKNQDLLDAGHYFEEYVALNFRPYLSNVCGVDEDKIQILNDTHMYTHPLYRFALCNLDRRIWINGIEGILEIKTTSNPKDIALWKKGIVPKKYEWQCRYYMATMNVDYTYIACMWGLSLKDTMAVIKIDRDLEIERMMMEDTQKFVELCEMGIEPPLQLTHTVELSKYYVRLYGEIEDNKEPIELPDNEETRSLIQEAFEITKEKEALEEKLAILSEREALCVAKLIKATDGKATYSSLRLDDNTVAGLKINIPMHRSTFDEAGFKEAYPDAYAEFLKEELPKFDSTKCKKKYPTEFGKYLIPAKVNIDKKPTLSKVEIINLPKSV